MRSSTGHRSVDRGRIALALLACSIAVSAFVPADALQRIREKDLNLDISRRVRTLLAAQGVFVVMTRSSDRTVPLSARTSLANARRVDVYVSIHNNASRNRSASGTQVYHQVRGGASRVLGEAVRRELSRSPGLPSTLHARRGDHGDYYYVLRHTRMPSVIVEGAFVTNRREARRLATASFRQAIATSIARGILAYQRTLTAIPLPPTVTPERIALAGVPVPGEVTGAALNARTVSLSWEPTATAIAYNVYRDGVLIGTVDGSPLDVLGGAAGRVAFTDVWAAPGQRYTYEIAATLRTTAASVESAAARVSVRTPPIVVALDPGHGGRDPGAGGSY